MPGKSAAGAILAGILAALALADADRPPEETTTPPTDPWARHGMRAGPVTTRAGGDCASLSTDDIRAFFERTPCRSIVRTAYPVTVATGATVAVSVIRVTLPTPTAAARFQSLHRVHGNGDITPVYPGVHFTALHYASHRTGPTVVFAETEPATGRVPPSTLNKVAEVAVSLSRP